MLVISQNDDRAINLAKKYLLAGKVIAIPTDTVYGLAVDASNVDAVNKLFMVKKRDLTKPIAIFLKDKLKIISIQVKHFNFFIPRTSSKFII